MTPVPPADAAEQTGPAALTTRSLTTRSLTDFSPGAADFGWYVVNDGVMGGRSEGNFVVRDEGIDFRGTTNTNGGGFSSIRTAPLKLDLAEFDGIRVRVRGDGRRYTWRLTTDARWRGRQVGYWADFETKDGEWMDAYIPFSRFAPQWRGRKLDGLELDPGRVRGMGLMIYDKRDGPFALRLDHVEAYRKSRPFALRDLKDTTRVLVVYAPRADDGQLQAQLADVAATTAEFAERDMQLVVLLDGDGSRVGERSLTRAETLGIRLAADIEEGAFALRLVGKDGGVKRASAARVEMKDIYALIDTMPMRRSEMER